MTKLARLILTLVAASATTAVVQAEPIDFVRDVRPLLQKHCYECHAGDKQKSGLRLDVKESAFKGGDNYGVDILPAKPEESPLVQLVKSSDDDVMPPREKERLSPGDIETLTRWVGEGAAWPDGVDLVTLVDRRDHWSFKPLAVAPGDHSIDRFIDQRLAENGLHRSLPAEPTALLRRLCFNLTGLPPTPEQVAEFVAECRQEGSAEPIVSDAAVEKLVERLLASPHYGERWAQHWLDVVRYADTHGFEVNTERPNAWPYRDYVIKALNEDTPYDRFIQEQLVGDALGQDAATGFLVTASVLLPAQTGADEPSKRLARQDALDEIVNNIGQTFLGLSVGCARCHDHKFDPITAKDYYAMQAIVAGVEYLDRDLHTPEADAARTTVAEAKRALVEIDQQLAAFAPRVEAGKERPMINAKLNADRFAPVKAKRVRFTVLATNNLEPCLDELEAFAVDGVNVALASAGAKATASGSTSVPNVHDLKHVNDGQYGNSRSWMSNEMGKGWVEIEFPQEHTIDRVLWGRDRLAQYKDRLAIEYRIEVADESGVWQEVAQSQSRVKFDPGKTQPAKLNVDDLDADDAADARRLLDQKSKLEATIASGERGLKVFAGAFRKPDVIHLLSRGDPEQPQEEVAPAMLASFQRSADESASPALSGETAEQERRRALADWIAHPQNPLTARVMANRIWQAHFGTGLVETPSDFGRMGIKPTHPELLDWLASEFIRSGWSIKRLHKLIVLSATYRQQSGASSQPEALAKDVDVRLLWRYPSRRLDAEAIRDAMLTESGVLNTKMYGRGFDLFDKRGGLTGFNPIESLQAEGLRRMVYAHKVRREREAVFGAFDCPDAGQSTARRRESTTPIQALNLFNSRFTLDQSQALADRVRREVGDDPEAQVRRAYVVVFSREPDAAELQDATAVVREHGLAVLGRALFNSNEALFIP